MYNVIIVDDEVIVREGIQNKIDWAKLGFVCQGVCENGRQAIELLSKVHVDIVLADIYMPFVNGLELAEHIQNNFPHIKTIILTGYDDFQYAQKALKLKVFDYLLKPITAKELKALFKKVKEELDEEATKQQEIKKIEALLKENNPVIEGRFLNRIVSGEIDRNEVEKKLDFFGIQLKGSHVAAAILDVDECYNKSIFPENAQTELLYFAVFNIAEELVLQENLGIVFQNNQEQTVILFSGGNDLAERAFGLCENIRSILEEKLMFTVTVGLSAVFPNVEDFKISYDEALSALQHRFLIGNNRVIHITEVKETLSDKQFSFFRNEKELISSIKANDANLIEENINDTVNNIRLANLSAARSYYVIQQVLFSLEKFLFELDIDLNELVMDVETPVTYMAEVYKYKTLDDIQLWLVALCKNVARFLSSSRESYHKSLTLRAEEYIKANYNNPDISVNSVCKNLFISVSYFSTTFKNATGQTFIEYLTKLRMEQAKELLNSTDLKTYEIAYKVGYSDPHYFSASFKKYTGETPTNYREGGVTI